MKSAAALLLILLITAFVMSVNLNSDESSETLDEKEVSLHSNSSERLLNIMQQISSLLDSQENPGKLNFNDVDIDDLVESVEELLFYAEIMALKVPATQLEESHNVVFSAMASKLYDETLNIQSLISSYDLKAMNYSEANMLNDALVRLSQTCQACHQLFRD